MLFEELSKNLEILLKLKSLLTEKLTNLEDLVLLPMQEMKTPNKRLMK